MKLLFLLAALSLYAEAPKPKVPEAKPISQVAQYRFLLIQKDMQLLNAEVCSEAGIRLTECQVDWQNGKVGKAEPVPAPAKE